MRRDPKLALIGAALCLAGLVATGVAALAWPLGRSHDVEALNGIVALNHGRAAVLAQGVVHLGDPEPYAIFGAGLVVIALLRGRRRLAIALPVVLFGAAMTSEILKPLLATPARDSATWMDSQIGIASWPSGHATAALTLALCAVLVAPRRLRPAVAFVGAIFAAAVAYAILILAWHFPSDVLGGYLVATTWVLLAVAALLYAERRRPEARRLSPGEPALLWPVQLLTGIGLAVCAAVAFAAPDRVGEFAANNTTALASFAVILALAMALAAGVTRTLRR
jgi:membrane-associated phospholipid phosphatase